MLPTLILVLVSMIAGALTTCICFCCWRSTAPMPSPLVVPAPSPSLLPRVVEPSAVVDPAQAPTSSPLRARARRPGLHHVCAATLSEELAKYTTTILKKELKEKHLLVGGLKDDQVARLLPAMADETVFQVACGIANQHSRSIPLESLRSNQELTNWCLGAVGQ